MKPQALSPRLTIQASAGSGKTWQLSNRIIHLLLLGEAPSSLIALTFTRNAAGEFFDAVLKKLAAASRSPDHAAQLSRDLGLTDPVSVSRIRALLLDLLYQLPDLHFGTLDSFFFRLVSSFSLELGLPARLQLMGTFEARRHRQQIVESILHPRSAAGRTFVEAFALATWGAEEKNVESQLKRFIESHFLAYETLPPHPVLPEALLRRAAPVPDDALPHLEQELIAAVAGQNLPDAKLEAWKDALVRLLAWQPRCQLPAPASTLFANILGAYDASTARCDSFPLLGKRIHWEAAEAAVFGRLCALWISRALGHCLQQTRGIGDITALFRQTAVAHSRRTGFLDYEDLTRLLRQVPLHDRLNLEYRIDQELDHWLLDEFQDTSRAQWQAIENFADEVIQDPGDRRTFFCVGDGKQSLYGWRGGDSRIYDELRARYGSHLETVDLFRTWRCSPPVVDLVNAVFTGNPALAAAAPAVAGRWDRLWHPHEAARSFPGCAAVYALTPEDDPLAPLVELLYQLNPLERGLSCAVLSPQGADAAAAADRIRQDLRWPVVMEGREWIARDNPYGLVLLAALRLLAHPRDTLAGGWLAGLPGAASFDPHPWRTESLRRIQREGFSPWALRTWNLFLPHPAGHTDRQRQLLAALRQFDRTPSRDPDTLFAFLEHFESRAAESSGAIQCMTIHASKGLGFDVVVLHHLDLAAQGIHQRRGGPLVHRNAHFQPDWLLEAPQKEIVNAVPELAAIHQADLDDNAFEKWCLLYVGMTRAKSALYVLAAPKDNTSVARLSDLVVQALPAREDPDNDISVRRHHQTGDPRWFEHHPRRAAMAEPPVRPELRTAPAPATPADDAPADPLFSPGPEFGIHFHQAVATLRTGPPEALRNRIGARTTALPPGVRDALLRLIDSDAGRLIFSPPDGTRIWIEKSFLLREPGGLHTGRWDRVHIQPAPDGSPAAATLFDFKTDADDVHLADIHRPQIARYRAAAARALNLPPTSIRAFLVHVPTCRLIEC